MNKIIESKTLSKYRKKLLLVSILWILVTIVVVSVIITIGSYQSLNKASTNYNYAQLINGNENYQSQIATGLSRLIDSYDFIKFINSSFLSRKILEGKIYESFVNAMHNQAGGICGVEIFQNTSDGIESNFHANYKKILSILKKSNNYFDIKLAYAQNYYDPSSTPKGFIRVYINKKIYLRDLFSKYIDIEEANNKNSSKNVYTSAFSDTIGSFPITIPNSANFTIYAKDTLSTSSNRLIWYGGVSIFVLLMGMLTLILYSFRSVKINVLDSLSNLHNILINRDIISSNKKSRQSNIEEITELEIASKSFIKILDVVSKDNAVYKKIIFNKAVTDIHEVKNYVSAVKNRVISYESPMELFSSLQSVEHKVKNYLDIYKRIDKELSESNNFIHKIHFSYCKFDVFVKTVKSAIEQFHKIDGIEISLITKCDVDTKKYIQLSEEEIFTITSNIINNAIQSPSIDDKEIKIKLLVDDNNVLLSSTDNGEGIDEKRHDEYFNGYSSKMSGTGHGLSEVKTKVEDAGGAVEISENNPCVSVTILIKIPIIALSLTNYILNKIENNDILCIYLITDNEGRYKKLFNNIKIKVRGYDCKVFNTVRELLSYKDNYYVTQFSIIIVDLSFITNFDDIYELSESYNVFLVNRNNYNLSNNDISLIDKELI